MLELAFVMRCLGVRISYNDVGKLLEEFDEDGSGGVELEEFENIILRFVKYIWFFMFSCEINFQGIKLNNTDLNILKVLSLPDRPLARLMMADTN